MVDHDHRQRQATWRRRPGNGRTDRAGDGDDDFAFGDEQFPATNKVVLLDVTVQLNARVTRIVDLNDLWHAFADYLRERVEPRQTFAWRGEGRQAGFLPVRCRLWKIDLCFTRSATAKPVQVPSSNDVSIVSDGWWKFPSGNKKLAVERIVIPAVRK